MKSKKKFKAILCPICGEVYFSKPDKMDYENELNEYLKGEVFCPHCGWIYELEQLKKPDTYIGFNKKTLNEYKKWYEEKIKEKPDYDYLEENKPDPIPHMCPICGKYEFEDDGSFDICIYCGWEDDNLQTADPNYAGGANELSLNEYKKQYEEKIKKNPNYVWDDECRSLIKMSTNGTSNRYGNTRGSKGQGKPTKHIWYAWAIDFNKDGLKRHFSRYGQEFNFSSKEEYVANAVKFANHIDRKNYKSVVDYKGITYKFDPNKNILVEVTKDGYVISYRHYGKSFWYEPKKGKRVWVK